MNIGLGIGLGFQQGGGGGAAEVWTPAELFASSEEGAWYDPSDLSTMWQDAAGTTPVTATDQPVGRIEDKSGNGNHATQSTAGARPLYKTAGDLHWLEFDGIDDHMSIAAGPAVSFVASTAAAALHPSASGAYYVGQRVTAVTRYYAAANSVAKGATIASYTADIASPHVYLAAWGPTSATMRRAASLVATANDATTGTTRVYLFPGAHTTAGDNTVATSFFAGKMYQWIIRDALGSVDEIEEYLATKAGVTLP